MSSVSPIPVLDITGMPSANASAIFVGEEAIFEYVGSIKEVITSTQERSLGTSFLSAEIIVRFFIRFCFYIIIIQVWNILLFY